MTRVPGVGAVAPLVALAIVLPLWVVTSGAISLARQSNDLAPVEVGAITTAASRSSCSAI
jgi:hypothetical protein